MPVQQLGGCCPQFGLGAEHQLECGRQVGALAWVGMLGHTLHCGARPPSAQLGPEPVPQVRDLGEHVFAKLLPGTFGSGLLFVLSDSGEVRKQRNERRRQLPRDVCGIHEGSLVSSLNGLEAVQTR